MAGQDRTKLLLQAVLDIDISASPEALEGAFSTNNKPSSPAWIAALAAADACNMTVPQVIAQLQGEIPLQHFKH